MAVKVAALFNPATMAKKKSRFQMPDMGTLIIVVFFICFLVWGLSQCSVRRAELRGDTTTTTTTTTVTPVVVEQVEPDTTAVLVQTITTPVTTVTTNESRLFITIDKLNFRTEPRLGSEVIGQFSLFDEVYFLNEVTDSSYTVNLGRQLATEPYVKVRSQAGKVGWVYGAGVHYYKRRHPGVE